jgi:tetratricopeptide (TPR) repeat protein
MDKKIALLIIIAVSALIYINTLSNGFVYDDDIQVLKNPWITDIRNIPEILSSSVWDFDKSSEAANYYYRPVLHIIYMAEYHIFGLSPWGWHLVNIIFHSLNAIMVFLLAGFLLLNSKARTKEGKGSSVLTFAPLFAALLFATHPINTEVVSWIASVTELFYALTFLLSLYLYILYQSRAAPPKPIILYVVSLVLFFLALFAKETALILPLIMVAYDYGARDGFKGLRLKRYIPYALVGILYLILRGLALEGTPSRELYLVSPVMQALNLFPVLMLYFWKLVLPIKLSPFYVYELTYSLVAYKIYLSIVAVIILGLILWKAKKAFPEIILFTAIIIVPLLPTFYLLFNDPSVDHFSLPSDRYLYLSSVGFALFAGFIYMRLAERLEGSNIVIYAVILLLILYSTGTIVRTFAWRDNKSLWENAVKNHPQNYYAHYALSGVYMEEGRSKEALREALYVKEIRPVYPAVSHRLGLLYFSLGETGKAAQEFQDVLKTEPTNADARFNLGVIYMGKREWRRAVVEFSASLENTGDEGRRVKIINSLAVALAGGGNIEGALERLDEAKEIDPKNPETLKNIRFLKSRQGGG